MELPEELRRIEQLIRTFDHLGIEARWASGQFLLSLKEGNQLPKGSQATQEGVEGIISPAPLRCAACLHEGRPLLNVLPAEAFLLSNGTELSGRAIWPRLSFGSSSATRRCSHEKVEHELTAVLAAERPDRL